MSRPQKFDRFTFLDDVMNLIHEVGYEAASVKLICEYTGITRSSFYNAFGTREKMLVEVLAHQEMLSFDTAFKLATPPIDVKALITNVAMATVFEINRDAPFGCFYANAIAELAGRNAEISQCLTNRMDEQLRQLEQILQWGVQSKQLPRYFDCRAAALCVQNMLLGASLSARVIASPDELKTLVETTLKGLGLYDEKYAAAFDV